MCVLIILQIANQTTMAISYLTLIPRVHTAFHMLQNRADTTIKHT